MQSLRTFAQQELQANTPVSVRFLAQKYNLTPPISLKTLLTPVIVFQENITSGGLAALGGWMRVTINKNGSIRWQGHAHDSGADGYDFKVSALILPSSGHESIALAHSGHVGGTFTAGSRDHDWDEISPPNRIISDALSFYKNARIEFHQEYDSDIGSAFETLTGWIIKYGVGTVLNATGVGTLIVVGIEVGSLISTGSLVPGARLIGGTLWMAGPANSLYAIAAEGISSVGSRTRELTIEEYDWANREVFLGSLPSRERIVLTDTIGGGNRAFTFPRYDGKITLNMGSQAFDNPRKYPGDGKDERAATYGRTFIHELVHACQIHHTSMDITLIADALSSKLCEASGQNPYIYGTAGFDYTKLNLEQQAQIVSDWFAGFSQNEDNIAANHTGEPKDKNSPYFRYINENLRIGRF